MTNPLRKGLPQCTERIARLPVDRRGFPVPRFVALVNGEPDHRLIDPNYMPRAVRFGLCWICGEQLGAYKTFLLGPMCTINRLSSEPPMHRDCAEFAATACPFLSKPQMSRRDAGMPEEIVDPPGGFIKRNPGAMCAWTTRVYTTEVHAKGDGTRGLLFFVDAPTDMHWFREGRQATREEVLDAIATGLPLLEEVAASEGLKAVTHLGVQTGELMMLLDKFPQGVAAA
jgi:hypothetical protein